MNEKIKIVLVDDHEIVLLGLSYILQTHDNFEIVAKVKTGQECLAVVKSQFVDVIILDIDLPDINGIDICKIIRNNYKEIKVIFHTSLIDKETIEKAIKAGASSYIPKKYDTVELTNAIEKVVRGEKFFTYEIENMLASYYESKEKQENEKKRIENLLTKRELEVLKLTGQGLTNKEIAERLFLSVRTVEVHKANIMKKLGVNTSLELVKIALLNFSE